MYWAQLPVIIRAPCERPMTRRTRIGSIGLSVVLLVTELILRFQLLLRALVYYWQIHDAACYFTLSMKHRLITVSCHVKYTRPGNSSAMSHCCSLLTDDVMGFPGLPAGCRRSEWSCKIFWRERLTTCTTMNGYRKRYILETYKYVDRSTDGESA